MNKNRHSGNLYAINMAEDKSKQTANNDSERKLEAIEKAVELEPEDASNWRLKGVALGELKRHDEALEAIEKAIELEPEDAFNWWCKGIILRELKCHDEALKAFNKASDFTEEAY